ncbi:MAG: histone deacetylase [Bdellovibrionales bacterium]|nr:histone deacetylase [Bdellovibrionales bacterium]
MGGALASAYQSLDFGLSGQLAGGTHHAHFDYGSGYCIFNDFAIVAKKLLHDDRIHRVAIIDLDVHQGDGNASLLKSDPNIFVLSLHGQKNFPFRKFESDLDIGLPDDCDDSTYLAALEQGLDAVVSFRPDIVLYQAGVDILVHDKLGRLNISYEGLKKRDERIFNIFKNKGIPISMAIGGGYSDPIEHSVAAYVQTYSVAKEIYKF